MAVRICVFLFTIFNYFIPLFFRFKATPGSCYSCFLFFSVRKILTTFKINFQMRSFLRFSESADSWLFLFILALIKSIPCFTQWAYFLRWSKLKVKNMTFLLHSMVQLFSLLIHFAAFKCVRVWFSFFFINISVLLSSSVMEFWYFWYRFVCYSQ